MYRGESSAEVNTVEEEHIRRACKMLGREGSKIYALYRTPFRVEESLKVAVDKAALLVRKFSDNTEYKNKFRAAQTLHVYMSLLQHYYENHRDTKRPRRFLSYNSPAIAEAVQEEGMASLDKDRMALAIQKAPLVKSRESDAAPKAKTSRGIQARESDAAPKEEAVDREKTEGEKDGISMAFAMLAMFLAMGLKTKDTKPAIMDLVADVSGDSKGGESVSDKEIDSFMQDTQVGLDKIPSFKDKMQLVMIKLKRFVRAVCDKLSINKQATPQVRPRKEVKADKGGRG